VNGLAGDDVINASAVAGGAIALTLDGGNDDDILLGGGGNDTLLGGDGDDLLDATAGPTRSTAARATTPRSRISDSRRADPRK
jgi:Ca2+-binding RTX toxin-like protein